MAWRAGKSTLGHDLGIGIEQPAGMQLALAHFIDKHAIDDASRSRGFVV
jgi:hypothetical protein